MDKDVTPENLRVNQRRGESRWERFWRRRRMNSIRNSSDHATVVAIGIVAAIVLVVAVLILGFRGADFSAVRENGPRKSFLPAKP